MENWLKYSNIIKQPNIVWSKLTFWLTSIQQSNQGWAQLKIISSLGKYLQELKMISYKHWFIVVAWHPGIFQNIMLHIVPGFYWGETTFSSLFFWRIIRLKNDLYEIHQRDGAWRGCCSSYRNLKCQFTACIYFYIKEDWLKIWINLGPNWTDQNVFN